MSHPEITVVIPAYNEEAVLPALFTRLYPALDGLDKSYEIIFVDDGSHDRSPALLRVQQQARPKVTRVLLLASNAGQHMAVLAGFEHSRGDIVITLDADLQNPPEEIQRLIEAIETGHDYVGSVRQDRQDSLFRRYTSKAINQLRERITHIRMSDQGSMLCAYRRDIVDVINSCREVSTFIPALAYSMAANPTEIKVRHAERAGGESKYSLYSLIRLNFDLITNFSAVPLQFISMAGMLLSLLSAIFVCLLTVRRIMLGPEAEGLFTLFGIAFFLLGILLFSVGLLGEYVGRIYHLLRPGPRYRIAALLEEENEVIKTEAVTQS